MATEAGVTIEAMEKMSLKVNRDKSGVRGSDARLTAAMRAIAGPQFGCAKMLKDLGVVQVLPRRRLPWPAGPRHAIGWHTLRGWQCP